MKQIKGLDTLRAFAVLLVIVEHWGLPFGAESATVATLRKWCIPDGQFGVNLFFVLSGFLITAILLHARHDSADSNRTHIIGNFTARRSLRIFPIYYLMLFVLLAIHYTGLKEHIWYYLTYTSNILFFRTAS